MPTFRTDREAGFTLLELLAVLVIMMLAASAVLQVGRSSAESAKVRSFLVEAEAMMRQARTAAIENMSTQTVVVDTKARRLVYEAGGKMIDVPPAVTLDGKLARTSEGEGKNQVVLFYSTGSSTGASLPFRFRDKVYELRVNWLTGHADVRKG